MSWLVQHPTNIKKARGQKKGKLAAVENITKPREFKWMPKHQQAFDALKEALVTAPVLGYPDQQRICAGKPMLLYKVWGQFCPIMMKLENSMQ